MTLNLIPSLEYRNDTYLRDIFSQIIDHNVDVFILHLCRLAGLSFRETLLHVEGDPNDDPCEDLYIVKLFDDQYEVDVNLYMRIRNKTELITVNLKSFLRLEVSSDQDSKSVVLDTNTLMPECISLGDLYETVNMINQNDEIFKQISSKNGKLFQI